MGSSEKNRDTIAIIAAMSQEENALLHHMGKCERIKLGSFSGHWFRLQDRDCFLVKSGMGRKHAVDAAQALIAGLKPTILISFGVAGAVKPDLQIGDVILARSTCMLDEGLPSRLYSLTQFSEPAWSAASQALLPYKVQLVSGMIVTTQGSQTVPQLLMEMASPVLDMETAGIAQVALEKRVPFIGLRGVSDNPQFPLPLNIDEILHKDSQIDLPRLIKKMIFNPHIVYRLLQFNINVALASENAAIALVAALHQPSFIVPDR